MFSGCTVWRGKETANFTEKEAQQFYDKFWTSLQKAGQMPEQIHEKWPVSIKFLKTLEKEMNGKK